MRVFRVVVLGCAAIAALFVFSAVAGAAVRGPFLVAGVSSSGHLTSTYGWTIQKSASPGSQMVAVGSGATVTYAIATTKSAQGASGASFTGKVCVANLGLVPTKGLAIGDVLSGPSSSTVLATVAVDVSAMPVLGALRSWCYPYRIAVPAGAIVPGATYRDTAHVTITNGGSPAGPSPSESASLPKTPIPVDGQVTVSDTNGQTFTFSAGGTVTYTQTIGCATTAGAHTIVHNNTATIQSTGQSASAQATIHCAAPTTLTTALSNSAINPGTSVTDQATINAAPANAGGTITYNVYSDSSCQTPFADATPATNTVTNATAPSSTPVTFNNDGTYYWQAAYSGDPTTNTQGSTSPCTTEPLRVTGWQTGDLTTYTQNGWSVAPASTTLSSNFNSIYTTGDVAVGGRFKMVFTTASAVSAYIPATGTPAQLTANLNNPASSPSGSFGGNVLALRLDVDFADAGALSGNSGLKFGDLTLCNLTTAGTDDVSALNGMSVRQLLAAANTVLGGGTTSLSLADPVDDLDLVARSLSDAFSNGSPTAFAQSNLVNGACA